ncbi:TPA: ead/Ea22-like family protein [Citrobacter koseri]|nr:ead/Ea22-like family protein [Citrobacter koseri]HEM8007211.1 ead/Ea22-like family protein [Citrobacter koseri]
MSNIDKQALRDIAEKTKIAGEAPVMPFEQRINALNDFMKHFTPATVLALLDELEAAEHTAAVDHEAACSLVEENEEVKRKLVAAEKRIAELRDWNAGLAQESFTYQQRVAELDNSLCELLPGTQYMDPPDGGNVTPLEQVRRMIADYRHRIAELEARTVKLPYLPDDCDRTEAHFKYQAALSAAGISLQKGDE